MKKVWTAVQVTLLAACVAGLAVGSVLLWTWHQDGPAEVVSAHWSDTSVVIGATSTLEVSVQLPWHRDVASAVPTTVPRSLVAAERGARAVQGEWSLDGKRLWHLSIPLVPVQPAAESAGRVVISLVPDRPTSPRSVSILLPSLEVESLDVTTAALERPTERLSFDEPTPAEPSPAPPVESLWPWGLLALVGALSTVAVMVARRLLFRPERPVWVGALRELERLDGDRSIHNPVYVARLMDILKSYVEARFGTATRAETFTELATSVASLEQIDGASEHELRWLTQTANSIRFAPESSGSASIDRGRASGFVRSVIQQSIPEASHD